MSEDLSKNEEIEPEDEEESTGGVREPKKPIPPVLPGKIEIEIEKEYKFDLYICTNQ